MEEKGEIKENGSNSRCSDSWKSITQELKLIYLTRAMSRCQKQKEVGFFPILVPFNLRVVNGLVVKP